MVLLDLRLPDADGLALLPWFTDLGLPVVMLTGVSDMEVAVETMRAGGPGGQKVNKIEALYEIDSLRYLFEHLVPLFHSAHLT